MLKLIIIGSIICGMAGFIFQLVEEKNKPPRLLTEKEKAAKKKAWLKAEKNCRLLTDIEEELNSLYYQRDLLVKLYDKMKLGYDDIKDMTSDDLKKVITQERLIFAINKKINNLETKKALSLNG